MLRTVRIFDFAAFWYFPSLVVWCLAIWYFVTMIFFGTLLFFFVHMVCILIFGSFQICYIVIRSISFSVLW